MDVSKILKTVNNLNDYIVATQEVTNKPSNSKIQFNMSTVLSLKKIRSLEIEYYNKCDESGAGVRILELMLQLPPSKTWSLLGKEIILLLQYWLEAVRKHLIHHNDHWWNFLSVLLKFILKIHSKHATLSNILVQDLTECLLDLATSNQPSINQRQKILRCFNTVCAESGREIRFALRNKFEHYFVKLSTILSSCGDIRVQFSILETLLRWLIPRQDLELRKEAALQWFPDEMYDETSRCIFLERPWQNFFKDAREFLNCHNGRNDLVTTVICRKFMIGSLLLINEPIKDYYLDLNSSTKCMCLIVEPSLSDILGKAESDAVVITRENTDIMRMYRESNEVFISVTVLDPQLLYPSRTVKSNQLQMTVSSRSIKKLDEALRKIFDEKYELLIDLEKSLPNSPNKEKQQNVEQMRLSYPVNINKLTHSGYIARTKHPESWKSPSSASTSSLAMLRDKLTAFPSYKYDKEPVSVCALPQLSSVTEITEEDRCSLNTLSTYKLRTYGVRNKRCTKEIISEEDNDSKCMTPTRRDDSSVSCLLVATIGSNESVINDTLERLPKDKEIHTDNIVELLAREAVESNKIDSGVVSYEKNDDFNTNIIEGSQQNALNVNINVITKGTSNSVVEESRFTAEDIMPLEDKLDDELGRDKQTYDVDTVEDFFSQHCVENRNGDLLISPSLAKKINETSSESSLDFDIAANMIDGSQHYIFNFDDTEVVECLNDIVDKVCEDLDKCSEYLRSEIENFNVSDEIKEAGSEPLKEIHDNVKTYNRQKVRRLKLQYNKTANRKKQSKLITEPVKRMTTIVERESEVEKSVVNKSPESNKDLSDAEKPLITRKRKLYSPKDDNKLNEKSGIHVSETEDDHSILTAPLKVDSTPKTVPTSYKDIEKIRRSSARKLRNGRGKTNLSPKTQKMNEIFDNLKRNNDGGEKIKLADKKVSRRKLAVYNFSSDSEDDDFRRKINIKKKNGSPTARSEIVTRATRCRRSKVNNKNNTQNKIESTPQTKKQKAKQKPGKEKRTPQIKKHIPELRNEMIDERMREATDVLNTSLTADERRNSVYEEVEPNINKKPEMEVMEDTYKNNRATRRKKNLSLKKVKGDKTCDKDQLATGDKDRLATTCHIDQSVRSSPLPGLIIETVDVQVHKDADDSITVTMLEKYKDIYDNEPLPDVSEINTTHNLLSDLEHVSYDPIVNMTEELDTTKQKSKKRCPSDEDDKNTAKRSKSSEPQVINISELSEEKTENSILTLGKSPITGHGDLDESPPHLTLLKEQVEPRGLDTQDLNQSMKNYFDRLTKEIYEESNTLNSKLRESIHEILEQSPLKLNRSYVPSPTVSIKRLSPKEISRWLPTKYNSVFGSNQSSESGSPVRITRSHTRSQEQKKTKNVTRKSVISPIKMFGESTKEKSVTSEQDDYLDHIKKLMTRNISKTVATTIESRCNARIIRKNVETPTASSINGSEKMKSPIFELSNKGLANRYESASGTVSSVSDWLTRNERLKHNRAESVDLPFKDNLEHVLEKLDTSLAEIHDQTSRRMFVDAQKHLTELKEKRRRLYKETAVSVITDLVAVMDNKFADLERRSQDLDQEFISGLKEKAGDLMSEDCKQKRLMVKMMKEDVQAALDHIN
ncbi:hypothetical protein KGM_203520 [Danaus plexippus plexippus]|uniref:Uncharacterized protein n=1 Tax=Danaus plexippus plexippus TaxID=278856 RepID=A0A212EMH1_DANPL|nr:hypothetical protein KGM_203520 [Danaus plexippus plexippus]